MATTQRIYIHAIPCSDSDGGRKYTLTPQDLAGIVANANKVFAPAGIELHFDPKETWSWTPRKDTKLNDMKREGDWTKTPNAIAAKYPGKIVCFFRWGADKNPTGNGFAYPPDIGKPIPPSWKNEPKDVRFVAFPSTKDLVNQGDGGFFAHEIGHHVGLYHTFPGAGNGTVYPDRPSGKLRVVSVGVGENVWGVDEDGAIFRREGLGWVKVSGALKHISVAADGTVWGVNSSDSIYRRSGSSWTKVAGKLKQISCGSSQHVWGVNSQNSIYYRSGSSWTKVSGKLKHVSVGDDGTVWGISPNNAIYRRSGSSWVKVSGSLKQISVANANNIWGVNASDKIYRRSGSSWVNVSGELAYVSVGAGGEVWGRNENDTVFRRDGNAWTGIGGGHGTEKAKQLLHAYVEKNGASVWALDGDLMTDTTPDPGTSLYASQGWDACADKIRAVGGVSNGKPYGYLFRPKVRNVMSYYGCPMPRELSKQQIARIGLVLKKDPRKHLVTMPCYADFHGLNSSKFQHCFDFWVNRGLWPVTLSATQKGLSTYMAGSFQPGPNRPVRHLITSAQFQSAFNTFKKQGFRPARIAATRTLSGTRFTAIWTPIDGKFETRHALTTAAFDKMWHDLRKKGYLNTDVCFYSTGSGVRVAATWVKKSFKDYATYFGMTSQQYQTRFGDFWKKGLRVTCFSAYSTSSGTRYAAIWEKVPGAWAHYFGMTSADYQKKYDAFAKKGLRLHQVQAYGNRFSAVWTDTPTATTPRKSVKGTTARLAVKSIRPVARPAPRKKPAKKPTRTVRVPAVAR